MHKKALLSLLLGISIGCTSPKAMSNILEIEGEIVELGTTPHNYLFIRENHSGTAYRISDPESYNLISKQYHFFRIKAQVIDPNPNRWPPGIIIKVLEAKEITKD